MVFLASLGIVLATVLGLAVGLARLSPNWLLARLAAGYVEALRNVPLLVQLFFWYFGAAQLLGENVVGAITGWNGIALGGWRLPAPWRASVRHCSASTPRTTMAARERRCSSGWCAGSFHSVLMRCWSLANISSPALFSFCRSGW